LGDLQLEIWNETAARSEEGITLDGLRAGIVVVGKKPAKQLNAALARLLEHKEGRFTQDGERYYADRIFANSEVGT
jgi:hypothetical protein